MQIVGYASCTCCSEFPVTTLMSVSNRLSVFVPADGVALDGHKAKAFSAAGALFG